jgi:hypothetical protein
MGKQSTVSLKIGERLSSFPFHEVYCRGITLDEARETLEAWYRDRPEVKEWQDMTRKSAQKNLYVRTMMGRYRNLPEAASRGPGGSHSLRAAINTPIQVTLSSLSLSLSLSVLFFLSLLGKCCRYCDDGNDQIVEK